MKKWNRKNWFLKLYENANYPFSRFFLWCILSNFLQISKDCCCQLPVETPQLSIVSSPVYCLPLMRFHALLCCYCNVLWGSSAIKVLASKIILYTLSQNTVVNEWILTVYMNSLYIDVLQIKLRTIIVTWLCWVWSTLFPPHWTLNKQFVFE